MDKSLWRGYKLRVFCIWSSLLLIFFGASLSKIYLTSMKKKNNKNFIYLTSMKKKEQEFHLSRPCYMLKYKH